jgi:hypothetical protein
MTRLVHLELLYILDKLVDCIEGRWFIGDGALLGIIRGGDLIEHDDDIDIYLLPGSTINYEKLEKAKLKSEDYYLNEKIYDPRNLFDKKNQWQEYCSTVKLKFKALNRCEILKLASQSYKTEKIESHHTYPNIDIFYLYENDDIYNIPSWDDYYEKQEVETLVEYDLYGIPVFIPSLSKSILERQYGSDWLIENRDFKYY